MKTYMKAIPVVVSRHSLMLAQVKAVSAVFNPIGVSWGDYRKFINLAECEELPGKRKRIAVAIAPLSFCGRVMFSVGDYDGVMVGLRVYHGGKEYKSAYTRYPIVCDPGDYVDMLIDLDECMD